MAMGFPRWLTRWCRMCGIRSAECARLEMPVLVVHSDVDGLFPLSMAERVAEACGARGRLIVINGLSHNAPIFAPTEDYWQPIVRVGEERSAQRFLSEDLPVAGD